MTKRDEAVFHKAFEEMEKNEFRSYEILSFTQKIG